MHMDDFNLTSFLSGGNKDPEQPKETSTPAAPKVQDAGSGSDFDLTKFIGSGSKKPTAKSDDYGILDRQRDTVIAETGENIGKGEALARNLIPFVGDEGKISRSAELIQLQKLYDGSAMKDITDRREKGLRGDDTAGERKNRNMVLDAVNQSSFMGNSGFGAALAQIQHANAQEKKTPEETYFDQLDNVAKNAGINPETRKKLRESSTTVDEFAEKLRGAAEGELKAYATRRNEAQARLQENEPGAMATIINGLITNTGYQGKYLVGGMSGGLSLVGVAAQSAEQRALALQTKDYDVDEEGNLVVIHNDDSEGKAAVKGIAGGVAEVAVEQFLEKALGLGKHIPGVGKYIGKASGAVSGAMGKVFGKAGAKLSKNAAGKWLVGAAQNFGKYQQYTGVNNLPMEMLEEHVQDFADDVLGFNVKGRDQGTLGSDAKDWWHNKFWNAEHNKDLFLGLIGTMAVQGVYAGAKAHHDLKKWRQNPAGFLKTVLDEKTVDKLSDAEVAHMYKLVSSPGFTKDKVDRFLGHVQGRTEMANALMELREANTPFFDTDKNAVDEAVKSGSVKSQFTPPTTDVTGGKRLDWQPFVWKDGTKTMRIFDPNTGIAIDKIGTGNKFCVTNRDGLRIVVDGETDGDASARALSVADKMSIHNQLLDAKRPAKEEYIKKRIAETAQNGRFLLVKNAADLDKQFPELKKSPEYSPDNPALKLGDGRIVLVTDNLKSAQEVNRMILHEAAIHSGLDKKFTTEQKRQFLRNIKDPFIERYKERVNALREARGLAPYDWDSDVGVEESFAHVWDRRRANPLLSQKINHFIREVGRSVHLPVSYNADDLEVIVEDMQRNIRKPGGKLDESKFDTTNAADSIPYNEAQRDFSGDVADVSKPSGSTEGGIAARNMQRNDRIKAAHPYLWEYAMRQSGGDEDAAADYVSDRLEDEGRRGVSGEMDHAHHALMVAEKLENGEDLSADDMEILDEHGFTGQVLYRDYGYRRQKNGTWKLVGRKDNAAHPELAPKEEPKTTPKFTATAVPVTVKKSNRQAKAEFEKKFVDRLSTKGGYIQRIPSSAIKTGDGRIVQFKEDADPRTGIVPGNELEGEYDETTAGLPVVMHFEDGHYETVTGRHRINLAQRNGIDINVMVLEHGEDGKPGTFSIADAEAIDAKANIKDGKGTIKDYIKFFRHAKMTKAEAEKEGLLGKKTQGRKAFALYNDATPELTAAVDFDGTAENDDRTITPEQAGIIAMNAPKDGHKLNGAVQRSMRDYCVKHPKANGDRLARLTQAKAHQLIQAEKDGQLKENGDGQMFLFDDMAADVAATDKLDEIENYKEKRSTEYKKLANRIRDAKNSKTVIGSKSMGSILQISKEAAQELDLIDTETGDVTTDKKRLEAAAQEALGKAFMWTRMELPADMQDELEKALKLGKYADQQDLPVQNEPAGDLKLPGKKEVVKAAQIKEIKGYPPVLKADPIASFKNGVIRRGGTTDIKDNFYIEFEDRKIHGPFDSVDSAVEYSSSIGKNLISAERPAGDLKLQRPKSKSDDDTIPHGMKTRIGIIKEDVAARIADIDPDIKIKGIAIHGSRIRGDHRKDSDLDAVVEFEGDWSEDALFNALHDNDILTIDGVKVDINPIRADKSGTLKDYMIRSRQHDLERQMDKDAVGVSDKPTPKPAPVKKPTPQQTIDAFSAATGIPVTMIGANGEVTADSHAAAETAFGRPSNTKEAETQTKIHPVKSQNGLSGVDLGENAADFDAALDSMWFSRELEVTPIEDAAYMDAVKRGDMETAQRMVREAAAKAMPNTKAVDDDGLPVLVWHHTKKDWTVPNTKATGTVHFFRSNEGGHGETQKHFGNRVVGAFLDIKNPLVIDAKGAFFLHIPVPEEMVGLPISTIIDRRLGKDGDTYDLIRAVENAKDRLGYDGIIIKNVEDVGSVGTDYLPFSPSQIKSADPVTYDDAGNVIPLSQRFNPQKNDIRWFSRELEGKTEEEIQAHNMQAGIKAVRAFAAAGQTSFDKFARTIAARKPEIYAKIRNFIPGMWLSARMMGIAGIEKIDEDGAKKVLEAVDQALSAPTIAGLASNSTPTASAEPTQAMTPPEQGTRGEAISAAADEVLALIDKGEKFDRKDLEAIVGRHLGGSVAEGTFSMKNATDILELAVNRKLRQLDSLVSPAANVDAAAAVRAIQRIRQILAVIPTQTTRSATQDKLQQFSTPPHEAFMAAWVANVKPGDVSLEPSAGIGGIAVFSKIAGADVIVNELDTEGRAPILEQLGLSPKVYNFNAENLWTHFYPLIGKGEVKRPTVVVMNPPFSNSATTHVKDTIGIGGKHIEEALQMLAPGGRLVAIVGHGMAHNAESPKVRNWWKRIGEKYCVRADVTVNGNEYAKYGTTYDNNLIVIDKVAPDNTKTPVFGKIESIDELPAMLEGVRNDRPDAKQPQNAKPIPVKQGGNGGSAVNGAKPSAGTPGPAGARPGEGSGGAGGLGRPNAGLGRPKPAPHSGNGAANHEGAGSRSGVAVEGSGKRADNVDHGHGGESSVHSPDATVIDAGGVKGEVNTDVREVGNGTFSEYRPSKVRVPGAKPHPTALVESTAMASVLPPDPTYSPILPKSAVENGQPSEAQIEQIVYAGQAHSQLLPNGERRGYFMGDGTGLGKGTEISGVICDNFNHGRTKAVWVSKSSNLFSDAQRDLKTFGLEKEVFEFDPRKKESTGRGRGIAFMSYSALANKVAFGSNDEVLSTDKKKPNRFQELVRWLGKDFDGVIVFDECHKAGNAVATKGKRGVKKPSNAGRAVVALQNALPKARILYVSATGATEVSNLSYATRLGLWGQGTAFRDRDAFIEQVSSGGLSVMEIVARDMKSMGVYMARSLSYEGIVNRKIEHQLSEDQRRKYDEFADAWQLVSDNVKETLVSTGGAGNSKAVSAVMSAFWGGQQRFFNQMLTAMQMPSIIADAKKQLDEGNSVVFQLVNTNEATQERAIQEQKARGEEVNPEELDLSPRDILIGFVEHSFPTTKYIQVENEEGDLEWRPMTDADGNPMDDPLALEAKQELLDRLRMMKLDNNPLEMILDEFGSENVAEITGRSRRREQVHNADGEMETVLKRRSPKTREAEIDEFNAGKRKVLVFSDAGGTGKSFHADRRFANTTKRVHYLVQAGWRADSALQGFGRTHRSNEMQPPEYVLCSTNIKGHQRFISTVARRLAQLGSLTAGDRSSAGSGVFSEEDNLENQYADGAVKQLFHNLFNDDRGRFNIVCKNLGFLKVKLDRKEVNSLLDENGVLDPSKIPDVPTFLNRILNCRVSVQNQLFDDFSELMHDAIEKAKDEGKYDPGLEKLQGDKIEETSRTQLWNDGNGTGSTDIVEVGVSKKSKKVDFETTLARMKARADGRDYFFALNQNSHKIFGFAETNLTKTNAKGEITTVLQCFSPDGKAVNVLASDVRFDGERQNFDRLLDNEAPAIWNAALASVPDMDVTKRYFVHGTLLPIWDRLGARDPRIFRIAPTGGNSSFLGLEIKADQVNDVLRRFGKSAQAVELTPEMVINRIVKDGKRVPLLKDGWGLKRARVNGDYRIELEGVEDVKTLQKLEQDGLGTIERIAYVPRFFIPRTEDGVSRFLTAYPAVPEDGGINNVSGSGNNYMALSPTERQAKFAELLESYKDVYNGVRQGEIVEAADALKDLIATMPTEEIFNQVEDFQQYDDHKQTNPIHHMRMMLKRELKSRGALTEKLEANYELWYSRELEDDDTSSVAIHEVNAWRRARGLPEMKKHRPTSVAAIVRAGKTMASNRDEMERFIEVSARTPQNWTATEVNAVAQRRIQLEEDYDEKTRLINEAEMNGNREEAQRIREARDLTQDMLDTMDRAINKAKREWGLAGLARRFMLNRNGSFVRFSGELQSFAGRKLTEEEETGARMLWDAYREAQGKLDEETVRKTSELLKDIVRRHMATEEQQHRIGHGKTLKQIEDEYAYALDHIRVHANRAGGVLLGLPDGRKWIDALRRYHMTAALETGRKLTVDEMLAAIHADIDGMIRADDHDIMQIITGHGNTYEADNSELEKAMREQRALMNEYQKWEDMMTEGHLPDKTGLIRDEPTQTLRDAQKITRDLMREFMEQHPELMQMDASKRLKTVQDSLMKRWRNEIEDLQKAIDDGEKIMRAKNVMTYTPEMQELRRQLEEKRREYHEMFPPEPLTHEEKVSRALRVLQRKLAALQEKKAALENATTDAERENILRKSRGAKLEDESLEAVRDQIADLQEDIQDLHDLHFPAGTVDEFMAMVRRRKNALAKNIQRIETQLNNRDFAPQKREPSALAKRVAADPAVMEAVKLRNAASQRLMQERERFRRSVLPYNAGRALDWFDALTSAPRVFRTMLDLSATMTQGAALFTSHPVLGWQALVDSVKSFYSADNTDAIMAALYADPDFTEFQEMGGRVYNVSNLDEKTLPEEFRGISQKVFTIRGKQYGIDDIPGVKASERSFGVFLNALNLGVYKAIKASGGWGPTGPTDTQKKDIAISLNVASGYGYDNKGGRGAWDRVMSAALWAPRFAVSGFKMAVGWNILAPQWTGLTTERSYRDRMVSSKVAAQQYVRQVASMAAWTLLATLLMGRKDPEWLEEMLNPLSANFLNVRVGNTNLNFFGPIKQWWTFMARMLTGKTMGRDGVVKNADQLQVAGRFARGKLSPLAGVAMDILDGKTFIGEKLVWDRSAEGAKEKNGWKHLAASVGIPLSAGDLAEAFKENTLANALLLTPFIVAGAGKSTIAPEGEDAYNRKVNPYKALAKDYKAAMKEGRWDDVKRLRTENPVLLRYSLIESRLKSVQDAKKQIRYMEKAGRTPSESLLKRYDLSQQAVIDAIESAMK